MTNAIAQALELVDHYTAKIRKIEDDIKKIEDEINKIEGSADFTEDDHQ